MKSKYTTSLIFYCILSFLTTICIVAGVIIFSDKEARTLVCNINTTITPIVKRGEISKVSVTYFDQKLTDDVSSMQVAIWNNSKLSIKTDNILEPLQIISNNKKPILEAKILKFSRDVCEIKIIDKDFSSGVVTIGWNILEKDDGAIIQITYLGDVNNDFSVNVTIEGQKKLIVYSSNDVLNSSSRKNLTFKGFYQEKNYLLTGFFNILLCVLIIIFGFPAYLRRFTIAKPTKFFEWFLLITLTLLHSVSFYYLVISGINSIVFWFKYKPPLTLF